jgi:isocitrate/isopropylmalate dehydrogenase
MEAVAEAVETAIEKVLKRGVRTPELPGRKRPVTTSRVGDLVAEEIKKVLKSSKFRAA